MNNLESNKYRCFFNLVHVKTFTIFIGGWHMVLNLSCIILLMVISRNPAVTEFSYDSSADEDDILPTPVSNKIGEVQQYREHSLTYGDIDMGGFVCLCMLIITFLLIYGCIKEKPGHLLPFFFLQLCDFAITSLSAAGYLCYLKTVKTLIQESNRLPWKEDIIKIDSQTLSVMVLVIFVFMVILKAYCIGIVWRCYKYLTIRKSTTLLSFIIQEPTMNQDANCGSLLPGYEEALNMKMAPPSYSAAMEMQQEISPPAYQELQRSN
ncbi:hypothetical protein PVAND_016142 [Polypedilum vanderplanki]|uniref:Lysosomal-associated transmembrane protein 4A n=1 Tax=Polypedilum vanderplanki TaxID=319348 RepID=A0A9J6BEZ3_POLVA|nr:hypothetical protein PVAND_016142 [Polypedilum vanderplanki]